MLALGGTLRDLALWIAELQPQKPLQLAPAIDTFRSLVDLFPSQPRWPVAALELGVALLDSGREADAEHAFGRLYARAPTSPEAALAHRVLGLHHMRLAVAPETGEAERRRRIPRAKAELRAALAVPGMPKYWPALHLAYLVFPESVEESFYYLRIASEAVAEEHPGDEARQAVARVELETWALQLLARAPASADDCGTDCLTHEGALDLLSELDGPTDPVLLVGRLAEELRSRDQWTTAARLVAGLMQAHPGHLLYTDWLRIRWGSTQAPERADCRWIEASLHNIGPGGRWRQAVPAELHDRADVLLADIRMDALVARYEQASRHGKARLRGRGDDLLAYAQRLLEEHPAARRIARLHFVIGEVAWSLDRRDLATQAWLDALRTARPNALSSDWYLLALGGVAATYALAIPSFERWSQKPVALDPTDQDFIRFATEALRDFPEDARARRSAVTAAELLATRGHAARAVSLASSVAGGSATQEAIDAASVGALAHVVQGAWSSATRLLGSLAGRAAAAPPEHRQALRDAIVWVYERRPLHLTPGSLCELPDAGDLPAHQRQELCLLWAHRHFQEAEPHVTARLLDEYLEHFAGRDVGTAVAWTWRVEVAKALDDTPAAEAALAALAALDPKAAHIRRKEILLLREQANRFDDLDRACRRYLRRYRRVKDEHTTAVALLRVRLARRAGETGKVRRLLRKLDRLAKAARSPQFAAEGWLALAEMYVDKATSLTPDGTGARPLERWLARWGRVANRAERALRRVRSYRLASLTAGAFVLHHDLYAGFVTAVRSAPVGKKLSTDERRLHQQLISENPLVLTAEERARQTLAKARELAAEASISEWTGRVYARTLAQGAVPLVPGLVAPLPGKSHTRRRELLRQRFLLLREGEGTDRGRLARVLLELGHLREAAALLRTAANARPSRLDRHGTLLHASLALHHAQPVVAYDAYESVEARFPATCEASRGRAAAALFDGDALSACEALARALRCEPSAAASRQQRVSCTPGLPPDPDLENEALIALESKP